MVDLSTAMTAAQGERRQRTPGDGKEKKVRRTGRNLGIEPFDPVKHVAKEEKVTLEDDAAEALARIAQGDLRRAITALQVSAAISNTISRTVVYETSATAPPEALHQYIMACREDGFHVARRRLQELLDRYGLAGTDFVGQLHRELYGVDFISETDKLDLTEVMAEVDYRHT